MSGDAPPAFEEDPPRRRDEAGPTISVDGYEGPVDHMLEMARTRRIDILRLPIGEMVDQMVAAILDSESHARLTERADWLVQAAGVIQLWTRLRYATTAHERDQAEAEATVLRRTMLDREHIRAIAGWLGQRVQLRIDAFPRGRPEDLDAGAKPWKPDRVAFLLGIVKLLDADLTKRRTAGYRTPPPPLHEPAEARRRIEAWLAGNPGRTATLAELLPPDMANETPTQRRSGWAATFLAGLELCRLQRAELEQEEHFAPITLSATGEGTTPGAIG